MRYLLLALFFALVLRFQAVLLRRLHRDAWEGWLGRLYCVAIGLTGLSGAIWMIGFLVGEPIVELVGQMGTAVLITSAWLMFVSSVLWVPPTMLLRWWHARQQVGGTVGGTEMAGGERRRFLVGVLGAIPAGAALASPAGTVAAMADPRLRSLTIPVHDLPEGLNGLRILQLSDIHLGVWVDVKQVAKIMEAVRSDPPDLVVLTGDIADDYRKLGPALKLINRLEAPLGVFACIGNHEIYRGREAAIRIWREHGVTYLCDDGVRVTHRGAALWLCGSDDPTRLVGDKGPFLETSIERALSSCPQDIQTRILLCHRPEGFVSAAARGVTLTLSGHTHGGQIAIGGRSVLEMVHPYMLGHYEQDGSHLYTTAGLGHWFPFRLNCPCEAVVITLRRG